MEKPTNRLSLKMLVTEEKAGRTAVGFVIPMIINVFPLTTGKVFDY